MQKFDRGRHQKERFRYFRSRGAVFSPASGHRTASGKWKWRGVAEPIDGKGLCELCDASGRVRLFNGWESAQKACDAANARIFEKNLNLA